MLEGSQQGRVDAGAPREEAIAVRRVADGELAALRAGEAVAPLHQVGLKLTHCYSTERM